MKNYKYQAKDYKDKVKKYWKHLEHYEDQFYMQVTQLEKLMSYELGIEDIEFFWCDNAIAGIGNVSKTMELIHRDYGED